MATNGLGPQGTLGGLRGTRGGARGIENAAGTRGRAPDAQAAAEGHGKMFYKPRALSRQHDADIKIEVHRDETIINHL